MLIEETNSGKYKESTRVATSDLEWPAGIIKPDLLVTGPPLYLARLLSSLELPGPGITTKHDEWTVASEI